MLFGNPVRGAISKVTSAAGFRLTQDFGPGIPAEPKVIWPGGEGIAKGTYVDFHQGIDLGDRKCGSDVLAARAGTVTYSSTDSSGSKTIIVDHGDGWRTWYGHLASRAVSRGAHVSKGQKIGTVGNTGNAIGCHLHFAVEWTGFPGTVVAIRGTSRSYRKFIDPWRRLEQNVRVRVDQDVTDVIRIRSALSLLPAAIYAEAKGGRIIRKADGIDLGSAAEWLDWDGDVAGPKYADQAGNDSTTWSRILVDGAYRFVARGYAELSAT